MYTNNRACYTSDDVYMQLIRQEAKSYNLKCVYNDDIIDLIRLSINDNQR
jgi:hypothetical protein